jgi:hypothetical protein
MATPEPKRMLVKKQVRISRVNPDNIKPVFANDFIVSHTDNEFFFTFSVLEPSEILDPADLDKINSLDAIAVVKVAVTPDLAERISKAISTNIEGYKEGLKVDANQKS